ncbi:MAG: acetyl-CoA carboxylase biotin carboxylase subunit [Deltaproteobacteria bacterium]|nr:acetyl-CoA carboxylase biotin carboxylase subunit [Deltaproteobacteria bacterium]
MLIANRGEIAIRVMRACRELGIPSVAIYSEADKDAMFTQYADEAHLIGPPPASASYLNIQKVLEVAIKTGADAIHPGYGFLAENPKFASACEHEGIKFIGPSSNAIELLGDKVAARRELAKAGVRVVPGMDECVVEFGQARSIANEIGYPVIIKPCGGGGGIGMSIVMGDDELREALKYSQAIASTTFGLGDVYIEKYFVNPRHVEIQILGDSEGNVIHLGERECSIQRRYQKLIEEAPSPALTPELRKEMGEIAVNVAKWVGYEGAGTVEFLLYDGKYYFLEVNARIQVEHPVTEMVTGIDIVKEQIRVASGLPLGIRQEEVRMNGWAIECRINAEDPLNDFAPSSGKIKGYRVPGGVGIRVDSGVYAHYTIPLYYDSMIAKLITWGRDRNEAIIRMRRALYEFMILGIKNNILFHKAIMENQRFIKGELGSHFIEKETTLMDDMTQIMTRERLLEEKAVDISSEKKRIAAIAAASALVLRIHPNVAKVEDASDLRRKG